MSKEWVIRTNQDLNQCFKEIYFVLQKAKVVKVQASSIRSKSRNQLGYYWSVILPALTEFFNEIGQAGTKLSKSDVNDVLNRKFFYQEVIINGEMERIPKSKSGATMEQMRDFIDNVLDYATHLGVFIPPPLNGSIYE